MRIFIALTFSEDFQRKTRQWSDGFRQAFPAHWLPGHDLHFTLIPPWEERNIEQLIQRLSAVNLEGILPLKVAFERVSFGPRPGEERLIWATGRMPRNVALLIERLERFLNRPRRRITAHVTLARFNQEMLSSFPTASLDEKVSWEDTINSLTIMETIKTGEGMAYPVQARFPVK